jgi:DMSO/TMAO reductase YedYZ heme-binding membrane subunit
MLRARLSKRLWRAVHYLSFPLFAVATVHGLTAGTDRHTFAMQAGFISVAAVIGVLAAYRIVVSSRQNLVPRPPVGAVLERNPS